MAEELVGGVRACFSEGSLFGSRSSSNLRLELNPAGCRPGVNFTQDAPVMEFQVPGGRYVPLTTLPRMVLVVLRYSVSAVRKR